MGFLPLKLIALVSQVTLFTACVWKHGGTHSFVIVSDYLHCPTIWQVCCECLPQKTFCNISIQLSRKLSLVLSDDAASQFKLGLLLSSITQLGINCVHDFFATSRCKGPVDAIGGTMKRLVSHEVMSGKAEVITSSEFA